MSSSCMSSRAYRLEALDLDIIKSPSSTSWVSNSPSPSSTLSECSNPVATRKPRTPRKRPNQKYNEAAAILSTAYPKIFPTAAKPCNFTHSRDHSFFDPASELLMPFQEVVDCSGFLQKPDFEFCVGIKAGLANSRRSSGEIFNCVEEEEEEDNEFDAESILDEEMGEGIESIMGNIEMENQPLNLNNNNNNTFCYGYPVGLGLGFDESGMIRESRAMRNVDQCDWWSFPSVNVIDVNPNLATVSSERKKMKLETNNSNSPNAGLLLKLNYDTILQDWSDKASPFSGDSPASDSAGNDVRARLAQIDLFWDNGGVREASVQRYKEKRRTRLFSKKIRYEVRKVNADRRPRMKGRFVRSSDDT